MDSRPTSSEPTLAEMLSDPIIRIVMRRDGVTEQDIRALFGFRRDVAAR